MENKSLVNLDAGLYVNLFEVEFEDRDVDLMCANRSQFASLRTLREQLEALKDDARVYAADDVVYGYGPAKDKLAEFGFAKKSVRIREIPQLTSRLILEGFAESPPKRWIYMSIQLRARFRLPVLNSVADDSIWRKANERR